MNAPSKESRKKITDSSDEWVNGFAVERPQTAADGAAPSWSASTRVMRPGDFTIQARETSPKHADLHSNGDFFFKYQSPPHCSP